MIKTVLPFGTVLVIFSTAFHLTSFFESSTTSLNPATPIRLAEQDDSHSELKQEPRSFTDLTLKERFALGTNVLIPAGRYEINETLEVDLEVLGTVCIRGEGPVTIVMKGAGPAIRLKGSMSGSASPQQISDETWKESFPRIQGIEILGDHPEACGIELDGTMQATLSEIKVRRAKHAIWLVNRNRNVVVSNCHFYDNSGIGLFLDHVNLHQINVANSHISYNDGGGIVVAGGNVRNLQVTGCDLEANMPSDATPTKTANILVDASEDVGSIAEVAITGNTIQHSAHYGKTKLAPGGANIRILGRASEPVNMVTITGNIVSDTHCHLHLREVQDATVIGNTFFTTEPIDSLVENCQRIIVSNNIFNPREATETGQLIFRNSQACLVLGNICHQLRASGAAVRFESCHACRFENGIISNSEFGVALSHCTECIVSNCSMLDLESGTVAIEGDFTSNQIEGLRSSSSK